LTSIIGFFLPANYYKQLARYIGLCVLQHVQQVGALRQLDRSRSQLPLYVYADEFYTFAYEGFTDAVNKLRDANISLLLAHQTFSDLEKVSKEFARGIWDSTRNKIVLYQNDPEVCDRIAKALGTEKDVELTVRRSVDVWMNSVSTHEASSKEVDAYRCHPKDQTNYDEVHAEAFFRRGVDDDPHAGASVVRGSCRGRQATRPGRTGRRRPGWALDAPASFLDRSRAAAGAADSRRTTGATRT